MRLSRTERAHVEAIGGERGFTQLSPSWGEWAITMGEVSDKGDVPVLTMADLCRDHGIERIDLGNTSFVANSTSLRIDDLSNITSIVDAGVTRLLVQGSTTDSVALASSLNLTKVAVTSQDHVYFDIYQAAGNDVQLWLQQGMAVSQV